MFTRFSNGAVLTLGGGVVTGNGAAWSVRHQYRLLRREGLDRSLARWVIQQVLYAALTAPATYEGKYITINSNPVISDGK